MREMGVPGMDVYRGHDGIRTFFQQWLEVFPDSDVEVENVEATGEWSCPPWSKRRSAAPAAHRSHSAYYGIGHWPRGKLTLVENHLDADSRPGRRSSVTQRRD